MMTHQANDCRSWVHCGQAGDRHRQGGKGFDATRLGGERLKRGVRLAAGTAKTAAISRSSVGCGGGAGVPLDACALNAFPLEAPLTGRQINLSAAALSTCT
eukprot:5013622-Pleurochrysis_carterae.AAC.3